jgi:hypothetical protein
MYCVIRKKKKTDYKLLAAAWWWWFPFRREIYIGVIFFFYLGRPLLRFGERRGQEAIVAGFLCRIGKGGLLR